MKVALIGSADGNDGGFEEKKVVRGDAKVLDGMELPYTELRKTEEQAYREMRDLVGDMQRHLPDI